MRYAAVESSVIAKAGYDAEVRCLSVILRDGRSQDVCPCSADEYAAFMAAPSMGVHWFKTLAYRAVAAGDPVKLREPGGAHETMICPRHTWDEDAGCCGKAIAKAALAGTLNTAEAWSCPSCGTEWKPKPIGDLMRHWSPIPTLMIFGGRR